MVEFDGKELPKSGIECDLFEVEHLSSYDGTSIAHGDYAEEWERVKRLARLGAAVEDVINLLYAKGVIKYR